MPITIRPAEAADAAQCGAILYTAFQQLADDHNFPPDFPSVEVATGVIPDQPETRWFGPQERGPALPSRIIESGWMLLEGDPQARCLGSSEAITRI
jgi:hypothetical protein